MQKRDIPQTLDDPPLALIFNGHQFIAFIAGAMIGVIVGHAILLALAGLFAGRFFTRYADKRADGFLRHAMYFHGIPVIRSRRAPSGLDRSLRA